MKNIINLIILTILTLFFNLTALANEKTIINKIDVIEDKPHQLKVSVDLKYSGEHGDNVTMSVSTVNNTDIKAIKSHIYSVSPGKNNRVALIYRDPRKKNAYTTNYILVSLFKSGESHPFYSENINYYKDWKEKTRSNAVSSKNRTKALLSDAINLIDNASLGGERLELAKKNLEKIILENPKNVQAYLEMARVKMKEDTAIRGHKNSNGVTQAKKLIEIALEIDDEYANTYILLGYVNTLEGNFSVSIENFKKAQSIGTKNMWLYSNWGRSLEKVNKKSDAIKIYQEAIALPLKEYRSTYSLKSSNRAISLIFSQLLALLEESKDWEKMNSIYQEKVNVFNDGCSYAEYAYFKLNKFGDYDDSINLAEKTLTKKGCKQFSRETLASSYLLKLAKSKNLSKEESKNLYNKSFVLMTNPVELITNLAGSKHTLPAIEVLNKKGIDINSKDTRHYTPLAYAIYQGDEFSANALINNGAKLNVLVSNKNLSYLMLAVAYDRENLVKLLIDKGVDTKIVSEEGHTALSIAEALGLKSIKRILTSTKGA